MTTTGDRNYYATMGNNGINLPANGVSPPLAGVYPFVPGNNNQPGLAAQTPALVALADGARLTGVNTQQQPANNPRQGQGDQNFVQQGASPVGQPNAAATTNDTLEGPGSTAVGAPLSGGVATVLAGLSNGQQEHGAALHSTGF
jgi:hypothetical protein